jgi:hypothetical protein
LEMVEHLRLAIEQLARSNAMETTSRRLDVKKGSPPSVHCNTSILNRNIPDDDDYETPSSALSHVVIPTTRRQSPRQAQQRDSTLAETFKRVVPPSESSTHTIVVKESLCEYEEEESSMSQTSKQPVYEEMIQKLERDVRQHIAFEN